MNLEVKQLVVIDDNTLNKITNWMYEWWGLKDGYDFDGIKCFMKHSLQAYKLPQTYGLFLNNEIIGMYQITYQDLYVRPDIYPWLANVYIEKEYRNRGYGRKILETVRDMSKNAGCKELFLYTKHVGFYEKFGWEFIDEIDTFNPESRIERLYKLNLK